MRKLLKTLILVLFCSSAPRPFAQQFKIDPTLEPRRVFTNYWKTKHAQLPWTPEGDVESGAGKFAAPSIKPGDYQKLSEQVNDPAVSVRSGTSAKKRFRINNKRLHRPDDTLRLQPPTTDRLDSQPQSYH